MANEEVVLVYVRAGAALPRDTKPGAGVCFAVSAASTESGESMLRALTDMKVISGRGNAYFLIKVRDIFCWMLARDVARPVPAIDGAVHLFLARAGPDPLPLMLRRYELGPEDQLPDLDSLATFVQAKPEGLNFPQRPDAYEQVRDYDETGIFSEADDDNDGRSSDKLRARLEAYVLSQPEPWGDHLQGYLPLWNHVIHGSARLFMRREYHADRNAYTDGDDAWHLPGYAGIVEGLFCLFVGEEEAPEGPGHPRGDLGIKLSWRYKHLPYILGYYARGLVVTLVALSGKGVKDLRTFNLATLEDRVTWQLVMFNVGRLLTALYDLCVREGEVPDYQIVKCNNKEKKCVKLWGEYAYKTYVDPMSRKRAWSVYKQLEGCAHVEQCVSGEPRKKQTPSQSYVLRFRPRLSRLPTPAPHCVAGLVTALVHVATALADMHSRGWMHRDVHWNNVGRLDDGNWYLIDLDEACLAPCSKALKLCVAAPEMSTGCHDLAVDVWGLGWLMESAARNGLREELPPELVVLRNKCLVDDPCQRPTIQDALDMLRQFSNASNVG